MELSCPWVKGVESMVCIGRVMSLGCPAIIPESSGLKCFFKYPYFFLFLSVPHISVVTCFYSDPKCDHFVVF